MSGKCELISTNDKMPEIGKEVLLYVKYRDHEQTDDGKYKPVFRIGHLCEEKYGEDLEGKYNFWGVPVEGSIWSISGWSYFFVPEVLYWCELPELPEVVTE